MQKLAKDSIGRRTRFRRVARGKRLFFTERDLAILQLLHRYRYLRATQLASLLQPQSQNRFIERLGDLYHEAGLINRPTAQWRRFDARYQPIVYELSSKGLALLYSQGEPPPRAVTFSVGAKVSPAPQFEHAMMIVDALVEAELETRKAPGQRFVPVDEILERLPARSADRGAPRHPLAAPVTIRPNPHMPSATKPMATHLIPDALYGIEHLIDGEKRYRFYALECEFKNPHRRSTTRLSSTALKRAAYEAFIAERGFRKAWGIPNLEVRVIKRGDCAH
ncbi:replication-relaxation family protein [Mesorhizobium sp. Z1-4]|uniref:replication-relaxation family protein n=1 Tax=Mesorhizobium sp. Z1-4 TaxID=2448478 RepID=UPI000FDBCA86|nr:replication-relaxation family protein [Mesorhizobium sp. Z1-4]